jgi:arylsulfatase A-like enzyme
MTMLLRRVLPLILFAFSVAVAPPIAQAASPNVLVILADDLGYSDLGCYGSEIETPHLDGLAAGGLRFTQGYNTARCWPSRGAILTGYYAQAIRRDSLPGGKGGGQGARPAWARLLPELLAPAGYRSYHSGKWHIDGQPLQQGFARSLDVTGKGQSNFFDSSGVTEEGQPIGAVENFYSTTAVGDHALKCLQEHAADHGAKPFFHYVAFTAPHFPLHAPQELIAKYRERYRAGWNTVQQARYDRITGGTIVTTALAPMERDVGPPYAFPDAIRQLGPGEINRPLPWQELNDEQQQFQITKMAIHAAMIDAMDQQIGRILAQLRGMNAFENTLVLFASDNGASAEIMVRGEGHDPQAPPGSRKTFLCLGPGWSSCANTPFRRHKTWVHEGGIATPWIVHWPAGIAAKGELRRQLVHVIDVLPTVLELAGVAPPKEHNGQPVPPLQGRSFVPALSDAQAPVHEDLWWCHEGHRAIRAGDWKLVAAKDTPWELYNLATDRCETNNLAASEPARVAELEAAWNRIADQCRTLAASDGLGSAGGERKEKRAPRKAKAAGGS